MLHPWQVIYNEITARARLGILNGKEGSPKITGRVLPEMWGNPASLTRILALAREASLLILLVVCLPRYFTQIVTERTET